MARPTLAPKTKCKLKCLSKNLILQQKMQFLKERGKNKVTQNK